MDVYRVDGGRAINWETTCRHYRCTRFTGHLGTGLYVYLHRPEALADHLTVRTFPWPWINPVVIDTADQHNAFVTYSMFLCRTTAARNFRKKLLLEELEDGEALLPAGFLSLQVCRAAIVAARRPGNTLQPINHVMSALGYDGVVNRAFDTNHWGSCVYNPPPGMPHM